MLARDNPDLNKIMMYIDYAIVNEKLSKEIFEVIYIFIYISYFYVFKSSILFINLKDLLRRHSNSV